MKKYIVYLLNLTLIIIMIFKVIQIDSDKSILIFVFLCPLLIFLNLILSLILRVFNSSIANMFLQSAKYLAITYVPIIILLIFW